MLFSGETGVYLNTIFRSLGMNLLYYAKLEESDMSHATAIASTVQQLSSAFGITLTALILQFFVGWGKHVPYNTPLPFRLSFLVTGSIICFSTLLFLRLKKTDGKVPQGLVSYRDPKGRLVVVGNFDQLLGYVRGRR